MLLRGGVESDLGRLVQSVASVEGVVAVILFGSRARGDYDQHSDYDLLVVFSDDEVMWRNRRRLYENVGRLGLFTQVLTRSFKELNEKTEPTFLQNVLEQGVLLYLRYPFRAPAFTQNLKSMAIVKYSLKGLSQNEKMKVVYRLFGREAKGKGLKGLVGEKGGLKLGDGCFMVPMESLDAMVDVLRKHSVSFDVLQTYAPLMR